MTDELQGRVFIVTGSNTGIGRVTAQELANQGARVLMACRSKERTEPVVQEIRKATQNEDVHFIPLDLGDLASVKACAERILKEEKEIHCLINNAGVAGTRGRTKDGFELAFGVNHLGPFLLTQLLLPKLKASGASRIVNVASRAHARVKQRPDWSSLQSMSKTTTAFPEYCVSKLANVLFTQELAKRLEGTEVTCYSLHPGVIASDIWRSVPWIFRGIMKLFMITNEEGALTTLHCALSEEAGKETGLYYKECKPVDTGKWAKDQKLADELWEQSTEWVSEYLNEA